MVSGLVLSTTRDTEAVLTAVFIVVTVFIVKIPLNGLVIDSPVLTVHTPTARNNFYL